MAMAAQQRQVKAQTEQANVLDGLNRIGTDLLHNGNDGALVQLGKNADGITEKTLRRFDENSAAIAAMPTIPAIKSWAQSQVARHRDQIREQLSRHETEQSLVTLKASTESAIETSIGLAIKSPDDPSVAAQAERTVDALTSSYGQRLGLPPASVALMKTQALSPMYESIIADLSRRDLSSAQTYFERVKDKIDPARAAKLQSMFGVASRDAEAQKFADSMYQGDLGDALRQASGINNVDLRDETTRRIELLHNARLADERAKAAASRDAADRWLAEHGAAYSRMPPKIKEELLARDPSRALQAQQHELEMQEHAASRLGSEARIQRLEEALTRYGRWSLMSDEEKASQNPIQFFGPYAETSWVKGAIDEQREIRDGRRGSRLTWPALKSIALERAAAAGVFSDLSVDVEQKKRGQLLDFLERQTSSLLDEKTGTYQREKALAEIDAAVIKGKLSSWGIDPKRYKFELGVDEQPRFYTDGEPVTSSPAPRLAQVINDVPQDIRPIIEEAIKQDGLIASDEEITRRYNLWLQRKSAR